MNAPFKPTHSKAWLERYLKKNYYKKKYDRYMWWRSYTLRNKPLTNRHPLRDRILNGDFDLGPYVFEIELVEHRINEKSQTHKHEDTFREDIQLDKARRKRLQEDRDKDEAIKLEELRKAFVFEFRMTKEQYDKEVVKPNKDLISFYYKIEDKFGKRGVLLSSKKYKV
jgi:hypothetical protein